MILRSFPSAWAGSRVSKIPTSGFRAHFRFCFVCMISCYTSSRSELNIAQIKFYDQIKVWQIKIGGWGHLGAFGVIWGQNYIIFKHSQIIYQNEAHASTITEKWFSRSHKVTWPQIGGIMVLTMSHFGSKFKNFQTWANYRPKWSSWSLDYEKVVFEVIRGHLTPNLVYLLSPRVKIWKFSNPHYYIPKWSFLDFLGYCP